MDGSPSCLDGWRHAFAGHGSGRYNVYYCWTRYTYRMRTNIVIDDRLMEETLRATGLKTKREAVELGLRTLLRLRKQEKLRKLRGKLRWEGDLDAMRRDE